MSIIKSCNPPSFCKSSIYLRCFLLISTDICRLPASLLGSWQRFLEGVSWDETQLTEFTHLLQVLHAELGQHVLLTRVRQSWDLPRHGDYI